MISKVWFQSRTGGSEVIPNKQAVLMAPTLDTSQTCRQSRKNLVTYLSCKELTSMIPNSRVFDQHTLRLMQDHDPVVQRYRAFFALFQWSMVPDPPIEPSQPGKRPHPQSAYVKALLLKINEGFHHCTQLRRFLVEHPLLVLDLGFRPVLNVGQPYGFDVERTVPTAPPKKRKSISGDTAPAWPVPPSPAMVTSCLPSTPCPSMKTISPTSSRFTSAPWPPWASFLPISPPMLLLMPGTPIRWWCIATASPPFPSTSTVIPRANGPLMACRCAPRGCACIPPTRSPIPTATSRSAFAVRCSFLKPAGRRATTPSSSKRKAVSRT